MMRNVILTGSSGGIGAGVAEYLLALNPDMRIIGTHLRNRPAVQHERFSSLSVDLADSIAVDTLAHVAGPEVWGVVCLHGATLNAMHWKSSPADRHNVIEANVIATMNVCAAFAPALRANDNLFGEGRIVTVSSVVAQAGAIGCSAYVASKGAVEAYTRALSLELAPKNVTANCIALGYCDKGMIESILPAARQHLVEARIPLRRLGTNDDVGALVDFLLGFGSGYITGQTIGLNGGFHLG